VTAVGSCALAATQDGGAGGLDARLRDLGLSGVAVRLFAAQGLANLAGLPRRRTPAHLAEEDPLLALPLPA
jgi:hypothetical protein